MPIITVVVLLPVHHGSQAVFCDIFHEPLLQPASLCYAVYELLLLQTDQLPFFDGTLPLHMPVTLKAQQEPLNFGFSPIRHRAFLSPSPMSGEDQYVRKRYLEPAQSVRVIRRPVVSGKPLPNSSMGWVKGGVAPIHGRAELRACSLSTIFDGLDSVSTLVLLSRLVGLVELMKSWKADKLQMGFSDTLFEDLLLSTTFPKTVSANKRPESRPGS